MLLDILASLYSTFFSTKRGDFIHTLSVPTIRITALQFRNRAALCTESGQGVKVKKKTVPFLLPRSERVTDLASALQTPFAVYKGLACNQKQVKKNK